MIPGWLIPAVVALNFVLPAGLWGGEEDVGDEDEAFVQLPAGIEARYETLDGHVRLERLEPLPRLYGPAGQAPHARVPAEGFAVRWRGRLVVPYDGQYVFGLEESSLSGLRWSIAGERIEPGRPVELWFGNQPLEIAGVHHGGPLRFRIWWENEFFARERIPPRHFAHRPATGAQPAQRQVQEQAGAALAESFGCFRCHPGPRAWLESLTQDLPPEVLLPGPALAGAADRVHRRWLSDFLQDPASHRPGTRMPAMPQLQGIDDGRVQLIVAYLTSGQTEQQAKTRPTGSVDRGEAVYQSHGCAACHQPPQGGQVGSPGAAGPVEGDGPAGSGDGDPSRGDGAVHGLVSLPPAPVGLTPLPPEVPSLDGIARKWLVSGLVDFLLAPLASRPHGRMPDFALSPQEARDLVAYLFSRQHAGTPPEPVPLPEPNEPVASDPWTLVDPENQAFWLALDEPRGPPADRSGRGRSARVVGRLDYGREGRVGGAMGFDGQGGHLVIAAGKELSTGGDFTWSAWVRTDAAGAIFGRAPREGPWVPGGKTLFVRGGKLCFDVGWVGVVTSKSTINDDRWHHVAVTVQRDTDGPDDTVTLYVDGRVDVVRKDWDIHQHREGNFVLKVGMASPNFPQSHTFDGRIDEAAMWTRALGPDEIATLAEGTSHLAQTEAALFPAETLKGRWVALGEDPDRLDALGPGNRLKAVALREMAVAGCLNCHDVGPPSLLGIRRTFGGPPEIEGPSQPPSGPPLGRPAAGCLGSPPPARAPRFSLTQPERTALAALVASLPHRQSASLAERVDLELASLRCVACHENEGSGGDPLADLLGGREEAQFILPPSLAGVASRLRPERLDEYLQVGTRRHRLRPWSGARMPGFGLRGRRLARDLCVRDGVSPPPPPDQPPAERDRPAVPQNQVEMGRLLVSDQGLTCTTCHAINGFQPTGERDPSTQAPNLELVTDHIRRDYFRRLLRDPGRIMPGTKMPVIFPHNGPVPVPALEDLPREALFQALWAYLSLGRDAPAPPRREAAQILPDALRVYVQRGPTYAGNRLIGRGISCGFPLGTLLFDADRLGPVALWFDAFLVRVPTEYFGLNWRVPDGFLWLGREEPPWLLRPAPGRAWQAAPLPLDGDPNTQSRFDGYTVGPSHVTFRYRLGFPDCRVSVTERFSVAVHDPWRGFDRHVTFRGLPAGAAIAWTLPAGDDRRLISVGASKQGAEEDAGPASAPRNAPAAVVTWFRREAQAARAEGEPRLVWEKDPRGEPARCVVGPAAADGQLTLAIQHRYRVRPGQPSEEEWSQAFPPVPPPEQPAPSNRPPDRWPTPAPPRAEPEEPFAYKLEKIPGPPEGWRPSGTAFTDDGWLYAVGLTEGRVYRTRVPSVPVPDRVPWHLYATGLNIPTGMNAIGNRLFVAHRPEVTELIDDDGDGVADTYRTLMGPWSLKDGFHEYAFGLAVDPQQQLYVALNNGYFWSYGGPTHRGRHRSAVMRCDLDGHSQEFGRGCRVPNGICRGPEGEIFFADNQGDWIQVNKIVHCRQGVFYGHPETEDEFLPEGEVPDGLPAIWIPYNVIRSAAALCYDHTGGRFGPFAGQMFVGDVGYGQSVNLMRVALEKVDGVWQGAAFRFLDGQPRGPQHGTFGPDGHLYISCLTDGLVRMRFGGQIPMEIHHVELRRDGRGFSLHLTKPIAPNAKLSPETIRARRWYYPYSIRYGSPRYEEVDVPIHSVRVSADRHTLHLELPVKTYKNCMVYYFHAGRLEAEDGQVVQHPEAWYTVQRVWPGTPGAPPAGNR